MNLLCVIVNLSQKQKYKGVTCYLEAFEEHSSYSSALFVEHLIKRFPFKIECIQTDNGQEFTKKLGSSKTPTSTMFEATLAQYNIKHKLIRPYTPRHNGKVEHFSGCAEKVVLSFLEDNQP